MSAATMGECFVSDAVVAACSIPFAFSSRILAVPEGQSGNQIFHHTIVDGGVWANFPIFVFEDEGFRKFDNKPDKIDPGKIIAPRL